MNKTTFSTPKAPIPSSHIAQVSCYGSVGFLSGQISQDRQTGEVIRDTVAGQTRRILTNIRTILEEMGLGLENVIKCNVFLSSMEHFDEMDAVYKTFFSSAWLAFSCFSNSLMGTFRNGLKSARSPR